MTREVERVAVANARGVRSDRLGRRRQDEAKLEDAILGEERLQTRRGAL
jgi:hypothetical protein